MLRVVRDPIIVSNRSPVLAVDMLGVATLKALGRVPDWKNLEPIFHELVRPYFAMFSSNLTVAADSVVTLANVNKVTLAYIQWILDRHMISPLEALRMLEFVTDRDGLHEVLSPRLMRMKPLTIAQLCREEPECLFVLSRHDGRPELQAAVA